MSFFSLRNILIFGVLLILLIGIPVGVYLVQQQQTTQSHAEKSSTLSFKPVSSQANPVKVKVGDEFKLDMVVTPGTNKVSVVAFEINYDPTLFAPSDTTPFVENKTSFPVVMDKPVYEDGVIRGRVSTQSIQTAVSTATTVATFTFVALKATDNPGTISYGAPFTQIFSAAGADEAAEDVLSSTTPAYVVTTAATDVVPSTTPSAGLSPRVTATPTSGGASGGSTTNKVPVCTSLTANGALEGVAPFGATFTAVGNDPDGKIAKATFNFGDGEVIDASNSAVASGSANFTQEHTYVLAGTHRASVVFTDNQGGISAQGTCVLSMTITSPISPTLAPDTTAAPTATMAPTGPNDTFIGIGVVAGILTFIGGLLFFTL